MWHLGLGCLERCLKMFVTLAIACNLFIYLFKALLHHKQNVNSDPIKLQSVKFKSIVMVRQTRVFSDDDDKRRTSNESLNGRPKI